MKEGDAVRQHVQTARWQDKGQETEMSLTVAVHGSVRLCLAQFRWNYDEMGFKQ